MANGSSAPTEKVTDNDVAMTTNPNASKSEEEDIDPIWLSSRTARQIYGLCQVEKVSIRYHNPTPLTKSQKNLRRLTADVLLWFILS